jgi:hypothetical protein
MKLVRETSFAFFLTLAAIANPVDAFAHEIKSGDLVISDPWSRQSPVASDVAAGFMKITNNGTVDDTLIKATAEIAPVVQLHNMKMEGDIMKMYELVGGIPIPAGETVELKPKSLHVMFMHVKEQPAVDTRFRGTLTFERAGTVDVEFEVVERNGTLDH